LRRKNKRKNSKDKDSLLVIPLGGIGEIGKNMFVVQFGEEIVVLDAGLKFPEEEMLGVDIVIPDLGYLLENKKKIKAIILTHGHEDHIGAIPYVLGEVNVPIYGTRLTLGLLKRKLEEFGLLDGASLNEISPGKELQLERIKAAFFATNHSIPDSVGVVLYTPAGNIVYTSDFKFDYTPVMGRTTDLHAIADVGKEGVLVALSDSTNAEQPGFTHSEIEVGDTLNNIFSSAEGRIVTVTFASNVHRIQQIVNATSFAGRKLAVDGRSMVNVVEIAQELGYLHIPPGLLIDVDEVNKCPRENVVILTTGTQGEPLSALTRLANANHKKFEIIPGDTVVIAATPIPGNEKLVSRTIDNLFKRGAEVIYEAVSGVHVSGHASQEELKLMLNLLRPRYLIPVHGEYRHLIHHANLAEKVGLRKENVFIVENGTVMEFTAERGSVVGSVQAEGVMVDGLGIGDVGSIVLKDRQLLSRDGIFIVVVTIDSSENKIVSGPDIVSRGFVYVKESEELMEQAREKIAWALEEMLDKKISEWTAIKNSIKDCTGKFLWEKTGRRPMILPIIMEVRTAKTAQQPAR